MSDEYHGLTLAEKLPIVIVIIATLAALYHLAFVAGPIEHKPAANDEASVVARIKPVADVVIAAAPAAAGVALSGEQIVTQSCSACHGTGALGSPKLGDAAAWAPRIAQGYETLVKHAIAGIRSMPARGGNAALSDGEVADAVAFMANKAGANFKAPAAK
ncbi:MAG: c-type cytochrome [Methylophilaceae bacterium]